MWLIAIVVLQLGFAWSCVWYSHIYLALLFFVLYILLYIDGKEYSGERRWEGFRNCSLWRRVSPACFTFSSTTAVNDATRRLFVMMPCITPAPMWWMAMHGGRLLAALNLCYMLPPLFFSIPILRDVVLWSGGVTYRRGAEPRGDRRNAAILDLLNANRSVCYAPSGFSDVLRVFDDDDPESGVQTNMPDDELFAFARENEVQIIPVVVAGEKKRYSIIAGSSWLQRVHRHTHALLGYPLPLLFWARIFSRTRPEALNIQIGPVINSARYTSVDALRAAFRENVEAIRSLPGEENAFHIL
jgi:hypothetical protein